MNELWQELVDANDGRKATVISQYLDGSVGVVYEGEQGIVNVSRGDLLHDFMLKNA